MAINYASILITVTGSFEKVIGSSGDIIKLDGLIPHCHGNADKTVA